MTKISTSITVDGLRAITTVPRGTKAWQKANSIFCPVGPLHSQAWILLPRVNVANLAVNAAHVINWSLASDGQVSADLNFRGFYLVNAERVMHGGVSDPNALYLCEFADARLLAARKSDSGAIRANLRSYANNADYLTGTSGYTWSDLVEELWDACGVLGAYPGLPAGLPIDGVPENTWLIGVNAWRALCAVLDQLDCAVAHNPLANSNNYTIVQLGAEQNIAAISDSLLRWDGQPLSSTIVDAAATLKIYYYFNRKSYGQERDTELADNWASVGQGNIETVATGIAGASGTKELWDDLPWLLDEDNNHVNSGAISQRNDNRKQRYVTRHSVESNHRIYWGLLSTILPGAQVRAVIWRNWDDGDFSDLGGTVTEFVSSSNMIKGYGAGGDSISWFDYELATPERENYSPPDLGRRSYPNYPRLPNIVQVQHSGQTQPGDDVDANDDGLHPGVVKRWVSGGMATLDPCWILFVDDYDNVTGDVSAKEGDYYGPARLSGMRTSEGQRLPLYLVRKGGEEQEDDKLVRFRLLQNLPTGGSAAAIKRVWNGFAYANQGTNIVVVDWYGVSGGGRGMWQGVVGMEGWAKLRENQTSIYDIIWMEQYARFIIFELLDDLYDDNGDLNEPVFGQVLESWGQGVAPPSVVQLNAGALMHLDCKQGARGIAVRDEYINTAGPDPAANDNYRIVTCTRVVLWGRGILTSNMCGDDPEVDTFLPEQSGDYLDPVTDAEVSLQNPQKHYGRSGDMVLFRREGVFREGGKWPFEVYSVTKHEYEHTIKVYFDNTAKAIKRDYLEKAAIETCSELQTGVVLQFGPCPEE